MSPMKTSLTPETMCVKIAEARGWKKKIGDFSLSGNQTWICPDGYETTCGIPDYCNDLNAMHEAEEVLFKDEIHWRKYRHILDRYRYTNDTREPSAFQRATAFIATLGLADATPAAKL